MELIKINKQKVMIVIVLILLQILLLFQIDLRLRHLTNLHYDPIKVTTLQNPLQLDLEHIRVMSLNIHHGDELDENEIKAKVEILADYIIQQKVHIAGLQEMRTLTRNINDESNYRQAALFLQSALERKSYPMYLQLQSNVFNPGNGKNLGFRNATISIFPLELIEEIIISGGLQRRAIVSKVKTPGGDMKFINVHVHHEQDKNDSYMQFYRDLESKRYLSDPNTVITGDFNNRNVWQTYYSECENAGLCYKGGIDFVGLPPQVSRDQYNFIPVQRMLDDELKRVHNSRYTFDHPAIIGDFRPKNVISPPTPVSLGASISQENSNIFVAEWNDNRGSKYLNLTKCIDTFCNNNNSFVRITPCPNPTQIGLANNDTDASSSTSKWCKYLINSDSSSNEQKRTKRFTFNLSTLGSGNYIFALSQEVSDTLRCLGNPACEENNGTSGSCGFSSCHSTTDFVKFNTETSITTPSIGATPQEGLIIDLNEDGKVDITDFALFIEYYKVGNMKIDYDKDGKTQRDIDDLSYFFENYKSNR